MKLKCIKCERVVDIKRTECVCSVCGNMMYQVPKKKKQEPVEPVEG